MSPVIFYKTHVETLEGVSYNWAFDVAPDEWEYLEPFSPEYGTRNFYHDARLTRARLASGETYLIHADITQVRNALRSEDGAEFSAYRL